MIAGGFKYSQEMKSSVWRNRRSTVGGGYRATLVQRQGSSEVGSILRRSAAEGGTVKSIVEVPSAKMARSS